MLSHVVWAVLPYLRRRQVINLLVLHSQHLTLMDKERIWSCYFSINHPTLLSQARSYIMAHQLSWSFVVGRCRWTVCVRGACWWTLTYPALVQEKMMYRDVFEDSHLVLCSEGGIHDLILSPAVDVYKLISHHTVNQRSEVVAIDRHRQLHVHVIVNNFTHATLPTLLYDNVQQAAFIDMPPFPCHLLVLSDGLFKHTTFGYIVNYAPTAADKAYTLPWQTLEIFPPSHITALALGISDNELYLYAVTADHVMYCYHIQGNMIYLCRLVNNVKEVENYQHEIYTLHSESIMHWQGETWANVCPVHTVDIGDKQLIVHEGHLFTLYNYLSHLAGQLTLCVLAS